MSAYLPTCSVAASSRRQLVWVFPPADCRQGGSKADRGGIREHRRPAASRLVGPLRPDAPGRLARPRHSSHQPGAQQLRLDIDIIVIIVIRSKRHIVVILVLVHRPSDRRPVLSSVALPSCRPPVGVSAPAARPRRHHPPGALGRHHRAGHDDQDAALARPRGRPGPTRWSAGGGSTTILAATATAAGTATRYWLATAAETHERVFSCRLLVSCPERKDEEEAGWAVK